MSGYKEESYTFRADNELLAKYRAWSTETGIPVSRLIRSAMNRYYDEEKGTAVPVKTVEERSAPAPSQRLAPPPPNSKKDAYLQSLKEQS